MPRPLKELADSGLLWLINRAVFHPRGFALQITVRKGPDDTGEEGWDLIGDGSEPFITDPKTDDDKFLAAEKTIKETSA